MNTTKEREEFTDIETTSKQEKATAGGLLQSLLEVVLENLVAIYEVKEHAIIMRILNGQKFRISVEEIK